MELLDIHCYSEIYAEVGLLKSETGKTLTRYMQISGSIITIQKYLYIALLHNNYGYLWYFLGTFKNSDYITCGLSVIQLLHLFHTL